MYRGLQVSEGKELLLLEKCLGAVFTIWGPKPHRPLRVWREGALKCEPLLRSCLSNATDTQASVTKLFPSLPPCFNQPRNTAIARYCKLLVPTLQTAT